MRKFFKHISSVLAVAALGFGMVACDDWTEPESIDTNFGTTDSADPAAYAKYLANLRAYRSKPHKKVYAWFDNIATGAGSQADRITALPDSIDVIVLSNPESITNQMVEEIKSVQSQKGMEVLLNVGFNEIQEKYTLLCESLAAQRIAFESNPANAGKPIPENLKDPSLASYTADMFTTYMSYLSVGVNGIMTGFDGKSTIHMTPDELVEYNKNAGVYMGVLSDFYERNSNLLMDFCGRPENISEYPVLKAFRNILLSGSASVPDKYSYTYYYNLVQGLVEDSQIGMVAYYRAVDNVTDPNTGYMNDGSLSIDGLAEWTAAHNVGCVGLRNVQNDYYVSNGSYAAIRQFIQIVNPAAK